MTQIPQSRKSPQEIGSLRQQPRDIPSPRKVDFSDQIAFRDVPLSVTEWLLTLIVLAIPLLNIVLYLYWAFFSKGNQSRINFCRASLILVAIGFLLLLLVGAL